MTGFLDEVHCVFSELQQVIQERTRQGRKYFLQRVFTSRVRVVKNHNFLPLSSWLATPPPRVGCVNPCITCKERDVVNRVPLISWTTSTYCSSSGSGYMASYLQGSSGRPSKAAFSSAYPSIYPSDLLV